MTYTRKEVIGDATLYLELYVAKNRNGQVGPVDAFVDIGANAIRNAAYGGGR